MKSNAWQGKKWYCYGTSMTDNKTFINGYHSGTYTKYLAEYAGLLEHNYGKSGSGIIPSLHGEDNIKSRAMCLSDGKAEADLITVEVIPNDGNGELGEPTDTGSDTFLGNLNQIIEYLLTNTNAVVVILIASRARRKHDDPTEKFPPTSEHVQKRLKWEAAVAEVCKMQGVQCWNGAAEAGFGYYRMAKDDTLVRDQIHLTDKGGELLAKYFYGRLLSIFPND